MKKFLINVVVLILLFGICYSCKQTVYPKPAGYVRLEYPVPHYQPFKSNCPFTFEYSDQVKIEKDSQCWFTFNYPKLKGKLYLTYYNVSPQSLPLYIKQSEKLVYEHTIKASGIDPELYQNKAHKVYGTFFELMGESATNFQFYLTDSTSHFLQGSYYFRAQPKPDSLQPAVDYIKKDLIHLIETTEWK